MLIVDVAQGTDLYTTCWKDLMSHCTIKHYKHMLSHAELDGITSSDSIEWYSFPTVQDQ